MTVLRWRRRYAVIAVCAVSLAVATPVVAQLAFDDDELALGRWQNAVVQFSDDGRSATVVVVYDAGERDRVARIELQPEADDPGALLEVTVLLEKSDDDGLIDRSGTSDA